MHRRFLTFKYPVFTILLGAVKPEPLSSRSASGVSIDRGGVGSATDGVRGGLCLIQPPAVSDERSTCSPIARYHTLQSKVSAYRTGLFEAVSVNGEPYMTLSTVRGLHTLYNPLEHEGLRVHPTVWEGDVHTGYVYGHHDPPEPTLRTSFQTVRW